MAKVKHTSDARVLVGIDISKHRHEVLIAIPGKMRLRRLTITNCTEDFVRLIAILREYGLPVRTGFEATGLAGFDPQVQFKRAIDAIDALVVPRVSLHVAQMQETQPKHPGLAGVGQPDQQISDLFVLGLQLRAIAIAGLADPEGPTGEGNAHPTSRHRFLGHLAALRLPRH